MARRECIMVGAVAPFCIGRESIIHLTKLEERRTCCITVITQNPLAIADTPENTRTLYGIGSLLNRTAGRTPLASCSSTVWRGQATTRYMTDSPSPFVLIEGMIETIIFIIDDGQVDGSRTTIIEMNGFTFQVGEVTIGITVILFVIGSRSIATCLQGEIYHILACSTVIYDFGSPYMSNICPVCTSIFRREMNRRMCPVNQVGRLRHHDATITIPSIRASHVGANHVKHAILAP